MGKQQKISVEIVDFPKYLKARKPEASKYREVLYTCSFCNYLGTYNTSKTRGQHVTVNLRCKMCREIGTYNIYV